MRRDRHGHGLRGPLAPAGVPLSRTRAQHFDDLVLDAVNRLESRWEQQLAGMELPSRRCRPLVSTSAATPCRWPGRSPQRAGEPARIVVYRRPAQARAEGEEELAALVFDVVVEEVARLLGVDPETVDPGYTDDD